MRNLLLDRLAIFSGGFTLETATAVCADETIARQDVLESLSSLSPNRSSWSTSHTAALVIICSRLRDNTHWRSSRSVANGRRWPVATRSRFFRLSCVSIEIGTALAERSWFREAEAELDNFRAALGWSLGEGNDLRFGVSSCRSAYAAVVFALSGRRKTLGSFGDRLDHRRNSRSTNSLSSILLTRSSVARLVNRRRHLHRRNTRYGCVLSSTICR